MDSRSRRGRALARWTALAVCLVVAVAAAFGSTLTPILTPAGGEVVLSGIDQAGFAPSKKPKVELIPSDAFPVPGLTTVKAKVLEFSASSIRFRVEKALAGVYNVSVTPAEKAIAPFFGGGFLLVARPAPTSCEPSAAAPKDTILVRGSLFGSPPGKVTIGGRKAPVKAWTADFVQVVVPKLAPGTYPVVVTNDAGPNTTEVTLRVRAPARPGDEYLRADIEGHGRFDVELRHPTRFFVMWDQFETLTVTGAQKGRSEYPILALSISPFEPDRAAPYTIDRFPLQPSPTIAVATYSRVANVLNIASAGSTDSLLTVDIVSWDGEFLTGTFHGTLVDGLGGDEPPLDVTNGEFRLRPGDAP